MIGRVDTALLSHDVGGILALAHDLEAANGASCPLH